MRMIFGRGAFLVLFALMARASFAQTNNRGCGTPTLPAQFETWVQGLSTPPGKLGGAQIQSVFNIPVIVHVIHNNEALNSTTATSGGNLNAAQINDQITILNKDFNGLNADTSLIPSVFKPLLGKFQFNFCMAVVNPTGGVLAEPGIDRIDRNTKSWTAPPYSSTYVSSTIKPNSIWDPSKYLNMWVMNLGSGLLGFATFPNPGTSSLTGLSPPYGSTSSDGLVMLNVAFGSIGTAAGNSPYHKGRTATHELGHWLGLRHIWGDASCGNDHCSDTPPASTSNYGCPTHPYNSGVCTGNTTGEMTMNYMDYTDDACMYMFTNDQKNRAQLIMTHSPLRAGLLTSTVCNTPTITNEVGILYVQSPTYSQVINCNNFITPTVIVHNFGTNTVSSATYSYNVDGINTQTLAWTGTLLPGNSGTVALPMVSNLVNGAHQYNVWLTAPNGSVDPNMTNNYNNQQFTIAGSFTIGVAGTTSVCPGSSTQLTASGGATGYTWTPGPLTGSQVTLSPTATTAYTISATNGTCVNTRTVSVTVLPSPTVSVNSPTICAGSSTVITASGACTYTWIPGNVVGSNINVSPSGTTQYTALAAGCNGCSATRVSTVTVVAPPAINIAVAPTGSLCPGGSATLTASGATTYSWNTAATTSVIVVTPGVNTTYTVTGFTGACISNTIATVLVGNSSLAIVVSPNPATVCAGSSLTLTAAGANTYTWSNGSNATSLLIAPSSNTTFTVQGTNGLCTATTAVNVSLVNNPVVSVSSSPAGAVCAGSSVQLSASGAGTYSWSTGSLAATDVITLTTAAVYTVTGSTAGCSNTQTIAVAISGNTLNMLTSASPATLCAGGTATLTATGLTSYTWTGSGSAGPFAVSPNATTTYTLNGADGPCPAYATIGVTVVMSPSLALSASSPTVCNGKTTSIFVNGPYSSYSWSPSGATGPVLNVSPATTTTYTLYASGAPGGCSTSSVLAITVVPAPLSLISTHNPSCDSACTGAVDATASGGTPPYVFSVAGQTCVGLPCGNLCPALYTLHTIDALGCSSVNYFSIECYVNPGLGDIAGRGAILVYPNPANETLNIELPGRFSYVLYNDLGQLLDSRPECVNKTEVNLAKFVQGIYVLEIRQDDEVTYRKVVKE